MINSSYSKGSLISFNIDEDKIFINLSTEFVNWVEGYCASKFDKKCDAINIFKKRKKMNHFFSVPQVFFIKLQHLRHTSSSSSSSIRADSTQSALSIYLSIYLSLYLSLSIYLSIYLYIYICIYICIYRFYRSFLVGPLDCIQCPHRTNVCKFLLVSQLWCVRA